MPGQRDGGSVQEAIAEVVIYEFLKINESPKIARSTYFSPCDSHSDYRLAMERFKKKRAEPLPTLPHAIHLIVSKNLASHSAIN